jgi:pyruvate dehydrogenase (quinone)
LGLIGIKVDRLEDVGAAWDRALAAKPPCVFEAVTDSNVPPIPPRNSKEQAARMLSAILEGDPDARAVVRQAFTGAASVLLGRP